MSRISLRWRITILMGVLLLTASILLTILSIQNMTDNFVMPIMKPSINMEENNANNEDENIQSFTNGISDFPKDTYYMPEINLNIENAKRSFSISSYLYMALVVAGSMIAAYYLAGRAMRPISKLNDEIETIDVNNLSKRISIPQTRDEIENLSHSFNELLTRLEQDFEKEKRFSANAAHELKTPLATIITSAQVLKINDKTLLEEYRENLDITLQSVQRLSSVVDGLLILGGTNMDLSFESVNFSQILYEIQKEMEPLYCEKNITLKYDLKANTLTGNSLLLYRAFFNLIENAYKYTKENGFITITSYCKENKIIIHISDTGIGIPVEDIEKIFEPFYRADKSRSRTIAGAGLGLSITKKIFDLHKAAISITSEKGCKTIVEVQFNLSLI